MNEGLNSRQHGFRCGGEGVAAAHGATLILAYCANLPAMGRVPFLLVVLPCWPAVPAELAGSASVIDGDTLEIHGQRIRLFGIDAPESRQTCEADAQTYRCGQQAVRSLSATP